MIDPSDFLAMIPWPGEKRVTAYLETHPKVLVSVLIAMAAIVGGIFYLTRSV
jgi:hypothetical protein